MTIIHTVLSPSELQRIRQQDRDYLKRKLETKCVLNNLLNRPVNKPLLAELLCILDRKPIARRKAEQRNSKVMVYSAGGVLVRIEHSNGKVMKYMGGKV